jgi:hypothetical protein
VRLRDELFLLGHDGSGRTAVHPDNLDLGVAGARLVELALAGRIMAAGGTVAVAEPTATGDPETDTLLTAILRAPAPPPLPGVLTHLRVGAADRVRDHLLAAGVLTKASHRRLGLLPVTRYPADEAVVRTISVRLWYAAQGREQPDTGTGSLAALVHAVLLHEHAFVNMPMTGLPARLQEIRAGLPAPVREIVSVVSAMIAQQAVAIYR